MSGTTVVAGTAVAGTAVAGTALFMSVDPNKLHHIFSKSTHNLDDFLDKFGGNQQAALEAVERAIQAAINEMGVTSGLYDKIVVTVAGVEIRVSGVVIEGVARIGTFHL